MQADGHNLFPNIAETVMVPVATQFQGAHSFNISGNTPFTNIGVNTGNLTTVNNYGGTHGMSFSVLHRLLDLTELQGLEKLEKYVSFAALHNSAEQDPDRRCHPGTRKNVLSRLRHWIDNPNPTDRIFWLYGPAGAGKSAIAQTIAHGYKQGEVAATFFFYRSDPARNDGNRLFTTIAWQLAFSNPAIKDIIVHALDKTPHLPMTDIETQFEQLVAHQTNNIARQMPHLAPVVIIDGVDECANEQLQQRFLTTIGNAVKDCRVPLRFLICSRPEALIEETLSHFKDFTLSVDLATLDDANRDIEKYLMDKFSDIASKQHLKPSWPGQETIDDIVFKSSGNFILASTLIRFIGDEDRSAISQLDIVRKLKPYGVMSPFALLDELYLEILKRQPDQYFLKDFLALLVGRSSADLNKHFSATHINLPEDDAILMNVTKEELRIALRRMRSLLRFEPFIDVYHKSFLDFLQDSARSGQYHVSKQDGQKRYLELLVNSVVRHVSKAIEQPNCHETCRSDPMFKHIVSKYPPRIDLSVEDWEETLKPLLNLQDKFMNASKLLPCRVTQVMRDLVLSLRILQSKVYPIAPTQAPKPNMRKRFTKWTRALFTKARQTKAKKNLDDCLSLLLARLQKTNPVMVVDMAIIDCMSSLLAFDYTETARRIRSVSDAQKLIDLVELLVSDRSFLNQCDPDAARKAVRLVSKLLARVPLLPGSFFLNGASDREDGPLWFNLSSIELVCHTAFISRILDHNYIVSSFKICEESDRLRFIGGDVNESFDGWLQRSSPSFVTRVRVMLEVARTIRYIHSMDIALFIIGPEIFALDSNLRAKILFAGTFTWWGTEAWVYGHEDSRSLHTYESNISDFADLFHSVCFDGHNENVPNHLTEDARQLIARCHAKGPMNRPTMEDVVKEMETWDLM